MSNIEVWISNQFAVSEIWISIFVEQSIERVISIPYAFVWALIRQSSRYILLYINFVTIRSPYFEDTLSIVWVPKGMVVTTKEIGFPGTRLRKWNPFSRSSTVTIIIINNDWMQMIFVTNFHYQLMIDYIIHRRYLLWRSWVSFCVT